MGSGILYTLFNNTKKERLMIRSFIDFICNRFFTLFGVVQSEVVVVRIHKPNGRF